MKILDLYVTDSDGNKEAQNNQLQEHHRRIHVGALSDSNHQYYRDRGHDADRQNVENYRDSKPRYKRFEIIRPADRDSDVTDGVFNDQIPADDPCDEFAERRVGIGVGA